MKRYLAVPSVPRVATPETITAYHSAYRAMLVSSILSTACADHDETYITAVQYNETPYHSAYVSDGMDKWIRVWSQQRAQERIRALWLQFESDHSTHAALLRARYVERMPITALVERHSCSERTIYRMLDRASLLLLAVIDEMSADHDTRYLAHAQRVEIEAEHESST